MLGAFNIKYLPQMAMKGQILANLVAKFTEELGDSEEGVKPEEALRVSLVEVQQVWQLFMDGTTN